VFFLKRIPLEIVHNHVINTQTVKHISSVMVSVQASIVVDIEFQPWSDKTENFKIGICCFSTKHVALRSKSKD